MFPGVIDVHLHFNEPGRTEWEGAATGSRALAAGGGTLFFDMPLNSTPCTVNAREFDRKRAALEASSITDFALWGGLVPGSVSDMAEMAARGVVGFKAFMCDSGLPEFPRADDVTLLDGLREAARLGLPVAVHAESEELTRGLSERVTSRTVRAFLDSRPVVAELEAIQRALLLAKEAGASLHIVHVSCGRGVALAAEARARGVDVSIETCPHYLFFTEEDVERLGAIAKCAPPLRAAERSARTLGRARARTRGHRRLRPLAGAALDEERRFHRGVGRHCRCAVDAGRAPRERVITGARCHSSASAPSWRRSLRVAFGIRRKGSLEPGMDADLVLVDLNRSVTLAAGDLHQRHALTPYLGHSFRGAVRRTIRRGVTIFNDGRVTATSGGRLIRPS